MKKFKYINLGLIIPVVLMATIFSLTAQTSYALEGPQGVLGASGNTGRNFVPCEDRPETCGFSEVYALIKTIIDFLLLDILSPVAIIAILFAGFKYVSAQGNPGEIKKAHDIFYYVVIGMVVAFAAWLIVNTILTTLTGVPGSTYNFLSN